MANTDSVYTVDELMLHKVKLDVNWGELVYVLKIQSVEAVNEGFRVMLEGGIDFTLPKGKKSVDVFRRNKYIPNAVIRERFQIV